jgi:hypothetical protein
MISYRPLVPKVGRKNGDASIPVVVPIIISIVMMPMMVPVPPMVVAVAVVVVRSVLLISGVNVNAKPVVCFRFGGCYGNQPEGRQTQEEISFHNWFS